MTISEEKRVEAYRNAPTEIRELYVSDTLTQEVDRIYAQYGVTVPFRTMSEVIGDTILGFYKITDLPQLLQQKLELGADDAQRITTKLIDFLSPVLRQEERGSEKKAETNTPLQSSSASTQTRPQIDPLLENDGGVQPLRTMEGDMHRVHGYGAYRAQQEEQEDVIKSSQEEVFKKEPPQERG